MDDVHPLFVRPVGNRVSGAALGNRGCSVEKRDQRRLCCHRSGMQIGKAADHLVGESKKLHRLQIRFLSHEHDRIAGKL